MCWMIDQWWRLGGGVRIPRVGMSLGRLVAGIPQQHSYHGSGMHPYPCPLFVPDGIVSIVDFADYFLAVAGVLHFRINRKKATFDYFKPIYITSLLQTDVGCHVDCLGVKTTFFLGYIQSIIVHHPNAPRGRRQRPSSLHSLPPPGLDQPPHYTHLSPRLLDGGGRSTAATCIVPPRDANARVRLRFGGGGGTKPVHGASF